MVVIRAKGDKTVPFVLEYEYKGENKNIKNIPSHHVFYGGCFGFLDNLIPTLLVINNNALN